MIVQPRFYRVLVPGLRPRRPSARPLHDRRGASLRLAGACPLPQLGSLPRRSRLCLQTAPLACPQCDRLSEKLLRNRPASAAPRLSRPSCPRCGGRAGGSSPASSWCQAETAPRSLSSAQIPRLPRSDWRALRKPSGQRPRGRWGALRGACSGGARERGGGRVRSVPLQPSPAARTRLEARQRRLEKFRPKVRGAVTLQLLVGPGRTMTTPPCCPTAGAWIGGCEVRPPSQARPAWGSQRPRHRPRPGRAVGACATETETDVRVLVPSNKDIPVFNVNNNNSNNNDKLSSLASNTPFS